MTEIPSIETEEKYTPSADVNNVRKSLPVTKNEKHRSSEKDDGVKNAERERVELDGRKKYFELRRTWSCWVLTWITSLIIFNAALTVFIGAGILDFSSYEWFITAVTLETFLQIVGMGYVAVRFLFSNEK